MWKDKLKETFDENPLMVVAVGGFAASAVAKLINAMSAAQGRRAYSKAVNYRIKHR
jgi:hypothetical protein